MLFHLDRNSKQSILNEFKKEALNYRQKKLNERLKRLNEEREYMLERARKEKEADKIIREEKIQRQNELMKEYQEMIKRYHYNVPGYIHKPRNNDIVNKNWGKNRFESNDSSNNLTINNKDKIRRNFYINKLTPANNNYSIQKEEEIIKRQDYLNDKIRDNTNMKEVDLYLKQEKINRQNYYKNILDSQYNEIQNRDKKLFGTIDPVIIKRIKRNVILDNPYAKKVNYDFGMSNLNHNPITNPTNDIYYNKYLLKKSYSNLRNNNKSIIDENGKNNNNNGNRINYNFNQFKTIEASRNNINNSKSCINIFRTNQNKIIDNSENVINSYQTPNLKNSFKVKNNVNYLQYFQKEGGNTLKTAAESNFFI